MNKHYLKQLFCRHHFITTITKVDKYKHLSVLHFTIICGKCGKVLENTKNIP